MLSLGWAVTSALPFSTSSAGLAAALTQLPTAGGAVLVSIANGVAVCSALGPVTTVEFTGAAVAAPALAAETSPTPGLMSVSTVHAVGGLLVVVRGVTPRHVCLACALRRTPS